MKLTPEQIAKGWKLHDGSDVCPIKDNLAAHEVMFKGGALHAATSHPKQWQWMWVAAYRIIEAHGADAEQPVEPTRPTPYPNGYEDLVFDADGWSQTIIVDGKRPEWLRDDDWCTCTTGPASRSGYYPSRGLFHKYQSIRVRRREPKRETVPCFVISARFPQIESTIDLIDDKPDLSTVRAQGWDK